MKKKLVMTVLIFLSFKSMGMGMGIGMNLWMIKYLVWSGETKQYLRTCVYESDRPLNQEDVKALVVVLKKNIILHDPAFKDKSPDDLQHHVQSHEISDAEIFKTVSESEAGFILYTYIN